MPIIHFSLKTFYFPTYWVHIYPIALKAMKWLCVLDFFGLEIKYN